MQRFNLLSMDLEVYHVHRQCKTKERQKWESPLKCNITETHPAYY